MVPGGFFQRRSVPARRTRIPAHYLGLCILADWIGSNETWFEYRDKPNDNYINHARRQADKAIREIGLDISKQRSAFASMPPRTDFADLFAIPGAPPPNAIQRQAALETPLEEQLVIIESETGSGKTEAALWRFARMFQAEKVDGLYFALPTRAAASQLHRRVKDFTARLFPDGDRPGVVLAVPGYDAGPDVGPVALPDYDLDAAGHSEPEKPWAAESPSDTWPPRLPLAPWTKPCLELYKSNMLTCEHPAWPVTSW